MLPEKQQQILFAHAGLIHRVAMACQNRALVPDLDAVLDNARKNGWATLVHVIREILKGRRDETLLAPLDEEDRVIVQAILRGIQDPSSLPDLNAKPDAQFAAPAIAALIHATRRGDIAALEMLAQMAKQMLKLGGDMSRLAAAMHPLSRGERDAEKLIKGMGPQGESLMMAILSELARLDTH